MNLKSRWSITKLAKNKFFPLYGTTIDVVSGCLKMCIAVVSRRFYRLHNVRNGQTRCNGGISKMIRESKTNQSHELYGLSKVLLHIYSLNKQA